MQYCGATNFFRECRQKRFRNRSGPKNLPQFRNRLDERETFALFRRYLFGNDLRRFSKAVGHAAISNRSKGGNLRCEAMIVYYVHGELRPLYFPCPMQLTDRAHSIYEVEIGNIMEGTAALLSVAQRVVYVLSQ
jgi:hypothetical protein